MANLPILGTAANNRSLPLDLDRLIETRLLLQANSGAGKSWALRRILEQTHGRVQHLVVDVEDEFHTLREKFDYVLAGRHGGDCPADVRSAPLLSRRLLELGVSAIIGIYELKAHDRIRFVRLFLDALVNAPRELWHPVLVVVDEAHIFCPQAGQAESASAVIDLMTRGRKRGFAGVLATQRISKLHKDAAAEANNKLIGRSALDVDMKRAADELGFSGRDDQARLRTLEPGEFFAFGPALTPQVTAVKVGPVETTHPRAGQRSAPPAPPRDTVKRVLGQLADLPHEAEKEARSMADLQAQVRQLEADLRKARAAAPAADPQLLARAEEKSRRAAELLAESLRKQNLRLHKDLADTLNRVGMGVNYAIEKLSATLTDSASVTGPLPPQPVQRKAPPRGRVSDPPRRSSPPAESAVRLPVGERATLTACAQYPEGATREQLSILTGYKRSSRDAYIQRLREKGFVEAGNLIVATDEGVTALGPDFEPLPTGNRLREYWLERLPEGERAVLEVLIAAYPQSVERDVIDQNTEYKRSSRDAYLQRLKARQLIETVGRGEVRASAILFEG